MRLLLVTPLYPSFQGQSRKDITYALHDFARHWHRTPETSVAVVIPQKRILFKKRQFNFSAMEETTIDGVKVVKAPLWNVPEYRILSTASIEHYLRATSYIPDVIAAHTCVGAEVTISLNRNLRAPSIFTLHQSDFDRPRITRKFLKDFSSYAFRSPHLESLFRQHFFTPARSFIATSGIDKAELVGKREFFAKTLHRPLRLLTVSSLRAYKNLDVVLRALSLLPRTLQWIYTIVGDGEEREKLETLADALNLRSRVSFLGETSHSECLTIMRDADVFVLVSAPETFGLVYLEAMAKGMVVIATKGTGVDGIVKDGENGFLASPRSTSELTELFSRLLQYPDLQTLRSAAYETILDYTIEQKASEYLDFLRNVSGSAIVT